MAHDRAANKLLLTPFGDGDNGAGTMYVCVSRTVVRAGVRVATFSRPLQLTIKQCFFGYRRPNIIGRQK